MFCTRSRVIHGTEPEKEVGTTSQTIEAKLNVELLHEEKQQLETRNPRKRKPNRTLFHHHGFSVQVRHDAQS